MKHQCNPYNPRESTVQTLMKIHLTPRCHNNESQYPKPLKKLDSGFCRNDGKSG